MHRSEWPSYLDALDTYLRRVSVAIDEGAAATRPLSLASRPVGPIPPQLVDRAASLLALTDRLAASTAARRDEVLVARGALDGLRRRPRWNVNSVEWAL